LIVLFFLCVEHPQWACIMIFFFGIVLQSNVASKRNESQQIKSNIRTEKEGQGQGAVAGFATVLIFFLRQRK